MKSEKLISRFRLSALLLGGAGALCRCAGLGLAISPTSDSGEQDAETVLESER